MHKFILCCKRKTGIIYRKYHTLEGEAMNIRKATLSDSEAIHKLVNHYAKKGLMLPRSRSAIYEYIRNYSVMEDNGEVIGVGALSILWLDLAEIRTLAVKESCSGQGIGKKLVAHFLNEAKELGDQQGLYTDVPDRLFRKVRDSRRSAKSKCLTKSGKTA